MVVEIDVVADLEDVGTSTLSVGFDLPRRMMLRIDL